MIKRAVTGGVILLLACNGESADDDASGVPVTQSVTEALSGQLDASGRFRVLAGQGDGELSGAQAGALAAAYVRKFADLRGVDWSREHGTEIPFSQLRPCGRPFYARSAYEPLSGDLIRPVRSSFGAWWMVTLCENGRRRMAVAVSALAVDLRIENGRILFPFVAGVEFVAEGIAPAQVIDGEYGNPEGAVARAFAQTGQRIRAVPELIAGRRGVASPLKASWRVELERPVRLMRVRTGTVTEDQIVYVGGVGDIGADGKGVVTQHDDVMVAVPQQPDSDSFVGFRTQDMGSPNPSGAPGTSFRNPNTPLTFERASQP